MVSCENATRTAPPPGTGLLAPDRRRTEDAGLLRPDETARLAGLRRDHPVAPELVPYVERYWSVRWDLRGRPSYRSEVLASPAVHLSIEQGDHPRFDVPLPAVLVHGLVTRRFVLDLTGTGRVTAAKFRPGGFAALTGLPPEPDTVRPLGKALRGAGPDAAALAAAVLAHDDDDRRAATLDACLGASAREPAPAYLELLDLLEAMSADRALTRVEDVAARAGRGVRSLQRLFATYIGVGPKAVLARYRLQDAVAELDTGRVRDLAGLAAELGWSDQAHFSSEFHRVVGVTPSAYLRRPRPPA